MMNSFRNFYNIVWKLKRILDGKQKRKARMVFATGIIGSFFELLGVSAVLPFIQAVMGPEMLLENKNVQLLVNFIGIKDDCGLVIALGAMMALIFVIKNIVLISISYIQNHFATGIQKSLSIRLLDAFMVKEYDYYLNPERPSLVTSCVSDVNATYLAVMNIIGVAQEVMSITFLAIFLIYTDVFTALAALAVTLVVMLISIFCLRPAIKKAGKRSREADDAKHRQISKISSGIKEIYITQNKSFFKNKFEEICEKTRDTSLMYSFLGTVPDRAVEGICVSGIIFVICLKLSFSPEGVITFIPKLAAFAMAAFKILPSVGKIVNRINAIMFYNPSIDSLYMNLFNDDYVAYIPAYERQLSTDVGKIVFDNISVDNLSYSYRNSNLLVLKEISLNIKFGEMIAFIGTSGSGKTTLVDCLIGLLNPTMGKIMIDNINIGECRTEWAKSIGYVPQNVFLMEDTLRNNVVFGEEDRGDESIWDALKQAQIDEYVRGLPGELESHIGESGVNLSGGQKQRLAIARALYRNPKLLILDEATSALDTSTEKAVMSAIDALHGKMSIIIIAHRLSTIKKADRIYEVNNGNLVERRIEDLN